MCGYCVSPYVAIDSLPMTTPTPIYDYVMACLGAKRVPQKQVAKESGVPFSTVTKIAQGAVLHPSVHTIQRLYDYFSAQNPTPITRVHPPCSLAGAGGSTSSVRSVPATFIIHAPHGSSLSALAAELRALFPGDRVIDGWDGQQAIPPGAVVLTNIPLPSPAVTLPDHVTVLTLDEALALRPPESDQGLVFLSEERQPVLTTAAS